MYWFSKHVFFFSVSYVFVAAGFNILWCLSGNTFFEVDVITKLNSSFYCTYYYWMYGSEISSLQSPTSFMMTVYIKLCHFIVKTNVVKCYKRSSFTVRIGKREKIKLGSLVTQFHQHLTSCFLNKSVMHNFTVLLL